MAVTHGAFLARFTQLTAGVALSAKAVMGQGNNAGQ